MGLLIDSKLPIWIEDDGSEVAVNDGARIPRDGWHEWAKKNCMTLGTLCCGGNATLKRQATDDAVAFLRAWPKNRGVISALCDSFGFARFEGGHNELD